MKPAIFVDRDGTLVQPRHYPSTPAELVLYEGVAGKLSSLQREAGYACVIITNQSGIARGLFDENALEAMHADLVRRLEAEGVRIDGIYFCPHHIDGSIPDLAIDCDCRKPEPGMLLRAAGELDLDLEESWMVGDILADVQAGNRAGCRTILVDLGTEEAPDSPDQEPDFVARDTSHALDIIAALSGLADGVALDYSPDRWQVAALPAR